MIRSLKTAEKRLKKMCRAGEGPGAALLREHYLMLRSALRGGRAALGGQNAPESDRLWLACLDCFDRRISPTQQSLAVYFAPFAFGLWAGEALCALLPAAFALRGIEVCFAESEDAQSLLTRAVKGLFLLRETDFEELLPLICPAEQALRADEAYRMSDAETRHVYRCAVRKLAREQGKSETDTVAALRAKGGHIGFYLPLQKRLRGGAAFLAAEAAAPLIGCVGTALLLSRHAEGFWRGGFGIALLSALLYLPLFSALRPLWEWLLRKLRQPRFLPSLAPESGAPLPGVLITVSSLLPSAEKAAAFAAHLETLLASHSGSPAGVAALLDLKNADTPVLPSDASDIAALRREIDRLNAAHGGGFLMAVRGRVFSPTEDEYTGFERKRGAIEALVRLLRENAPVFDELHGDRAMLKNAEFLLALDADTGLPFEELRKLLCVAAHPMNRAVLNDEKTGLVSGYGCFAPRSEASVSASEATFFSRVMTWGGVSAYSPRVSSRYMDLFASSVFSGKGLIDIDVYHALCMDVFPAGRVLSHDILEGALLRTAFVSTAAVTEGFPASPGSFFKRQHRWIRGDIQNLAFVFRPLKGEKRKTALPALARLQLADNAARAVTPVFCLAALLLSTLFPLRISVFMVGVGLLGMAAPDLFAAGSILLREGAFGFSRVYFSACFSAGARALLRALLRIALLPYEAFVSADAVLRALYRTLVSRRKTLQWTTAADAEAHGGRPIFAAALFPLLCACVPVFGRAYHYALALLFLGGIPFALSAGGKRRRAKTAPSAGEADSLLQYAAAMWRYYAEYAGPEDHFLPPDNMQETPVRRVAHRTSPTNIGLYLCCVLAAADLNLISPRELCDRLSSSLETVFSLPRRQGLLYNWYNTRTLQPLHPAFISSVDCGNYLVCLTALREGLREYAALGLRFSVLIQSIGAELDRARIETLYVPGRRLFSIGMNVSSGKLSDSYYDCYMSEARMTSFYAVARRLVPASHWAAPDRSFLRRGRYTAAASYGGTAFEYFMPALFLPLYSNTYADEGLKSCLYEQKRRVRGTNRPWGVSESAWYAFDGALNYRYRAHGLRALALRQDPEDVPVFAPYACFLALPLDLRGALANLRRFAALGAYGDCGFYEAVDFSPGDMGEDYMIVRSYMAHHVGMSMLACVNALRDNVFVRRFMRDTAMAGAKSLLMEKIPAAAPVLRPPRAKAREKRMPDHRAAAPAGTLTDAAVYSNGEVSLVCDGAGRNYLLYGGRSLFAYSPRCRGIIAAARVGETLLCPAKGEGELRPTGFLAGVEAEGISLRSALALVDECSALAVPVKLKNRSKTGCTAEFLYYFEPQGEPLFRASEHPAFADMGIRISYERNLNALLFRRVERGRSPVWFSVGFSDFSPFTFCCDRETLLSGAAAEDLPFAAFSVPFSDNTAFTFPAAAIRTEARVPAGATLEKVLLVCPAAGREGALERLSRLRRRHLPDLDRAVHCPIPARNLQIARRFLRAVFFGDADPGVSAAAAENTAPAAAMWEKGLSGDLPVLRVQTDGLPAEVLRDILEVYRAFVFCGIPADLVLLSGKAAEYGEAAAALDRLIKDADLGHLRDVPGGIKVLFRESCSKAFLSALAAATGMCFPFDAPLLPGEAPETALPVRPLFGGENGFVPNGYFIASPPPRPWSHTLANPVFGTLLTWGSLGFTWALNSRLNQLTPWHNDPCTPAPGERLLFHAGGKTYDCLKGAAVYFTDQAAVYGALAGGVQLRITVRVDEKAMKKQVRVRWRGAEGGTLAYRILPHMCDGAARQHYVHGAVVSGGLTFTNPANTDYGGYMRLFADLPGEVAFRRGAGTLHIPLKGATGEVCFCLAWAASAAALEALCALPFRPMQPRRKEIKHSDPVVSRFAGALLLHGVYNTRVLARVGFFQNSGAFGFRDQLQDCMNIIDVYPERARVQLLRCAAAQFPEGDALHWFHPVTLPRPHLKGVRTRCADDALWLPLAAAEYAAVTGDTAALDLPVPFLAGEALSKDERERYGDWYGGEHRRSLYTHCLCTLKNALRFGPHGLPLLRGGDWNDSFNEAGAAGRGESVWLSMFLSVVCEAFAPLARARQDPETANALLLIAADQREKIMTCAFNGRYFLRGFYDSGAPLGDKNADSCAIDLLPQAFAVFAGVGAADLRRRALREAWNKLWDPAYKTLRLFYPPFTEAPPRAGYVNDYPPGVRENAGQYTHAAVWFAMALRREGLTEEYEALLPALIPALRSKDTFLNKRFLNEPYAVTADICMAPGLEGRGGWSLYTGAAGWLRRLLMGGDFPLTKGNPQFSD